VPWKKPVGKYPGNWDRIKSLVMDRAGYKCEICGEMPDKFKKDYHYGRYDNNKTNKFKIHHKDINKSNNDLSNLMYVCMWCHGELHRQINLGE
jgi:predicted HNH restriction endonuclease